jgi:RimJ/RimL family protein N-acetyltransferase
VDRLLLDDDARVNAWLDGQMGYAVASSIKPAIGFERDGELVAGVVFDNATDNNVFAHMASTVTTGVPIELLSACYLYAFKQLGLARVSLLVRADNVRCLRFIEKWGATLEARIERACKACDQLIYVLWRTPALDAILLAERT